MSEKVPGNMALVDNTVFLDDTHSKPLWVCSDRTIYFEAFGKGYKEVNAFLSKFTSPLSRMSHIHTHTINNSSLYTASSMGFGKDEILSELLKYSKGEVPIEVIDFINACDLKFGKATIVLRKDGHFIESSNRDIIDDIYRDTEISSLAKGQVLEKEVLLSSHYFDMNLEVDEQEILNQIDAINKRDEELTHTKTVYYFQLDRNLIEIAKRRCIEIGYPLLEEYDYLKHVGGDISISLKSSTTLRKYQQQSLANIFSNGRMRSGIVSLACGAGKSLVGVVACSTLKKKTLVLCTSNVSVYQWVHQFKLWTNIHQADIVTFCSNEKNKIGTKEDLGSVLVSTYSMLSGSHNRSGYSKHVIDLIEKEEWGLVILDEVHVVPASTFRTLTSKIKSHCKLGLSATLVREDDLIDHLLYLIGPKLYEANWTDLAKSGYIANALCSEVLCPMTDLFFEEYIKSSSKLGRSLFNLNPNKIRACEYLINLHEQRNDRILVFSDDIYSLKFYANLLNRPFLYGPTSNSERLRLLSQFRYSSNMKTLFISKVGDYSINLPEANVLIQISSHYGSRRQEAQRLGRILRPKNRHIHRNQYDAFFYSIVSQDTKEIYFSSKRRKFLIEQGYSFRVLEDLHTNESMCTIASQLNEKQLLNSLLTCDQKLLEENDASIEQISELLINNPDSINLDFQQFTYERREGSSMSDLSGGTTLRYIELED